MLPAGPPATHAADAPARRAAKPNRTTTNAGNVNALPRAKGAAQPPRRRRRGRPRVRLLRGRRRGGADVAPRAALRRPQPTFRVQRSRWPFTPPTLPSGTPPPLGRRKPTGRAANTALEPAPAARDTTLALAPRHTADVRYDDPAIRRVLRAIPRAEGEPSALPSGTHSPSAGGSPPAERRTWPSRAIPPRVEGDPSVRQLMYDTVTPRSGEYRPRQAAPSPLSRRKPAGRAANVALAPAPAAPDTTLASRLRTTR